MASAGLEERFKELVVARTGLILRDEEQARLQKAISARLERLRLSDAAEYCELLSRNGSEWDELIPLLTTGETYFLRDQGQCALLETHILPDLIEQNRQRRSLRLWSAGCSSGEEAYSLAIMIDRLLPDRADWEIRIVGTDINLQALQRARRACYGAWSFRIVEADFRTRYFRPRGIQWQVIEGIRSMVAFRPGNLVTDPLPNHAAALHDMDLIVCRNVFIYFSSEVIASVLKKLTATLTPGGYLLTGHTELHGQDLGPLRLRLFPGAVVYEHTGRLPSGEGSTPVWKPAENDSESSRRVPTAQGGEGLSAVQTGRRAAAGSQPPRAPATPAFVKNGGRSTPPADTDPAARANHPGALLAEAQSLFDGGQYRRAIAAAMRVAPNEACGPQATLVAARAYANLGELDAALRCCREVVERDPLNADAYYLLAHLAEERGDREEVKRLLKKVLYVDAECVTAHLELGSLYEEEGDAERANRMRLTAVRLLKTMPADASVPHWPGLTAQELRATVELMIARSEAPVCRSAGMH